MCQSGSKKSYSVNERIHKPVNAFAVHPNTHHGHGDGSENELGGGKEEWPSLGTQSTRGRSPERNSGPFTALEDSVGDLSEDIGPRTKHRKPRAKPGVPFKVLKARAAAEESEEDDGDPFAQVAGLPHELLARIFAHLDPRSIARCASVCRAFAQASQDDSTWRLAVSIAFGIEATGPHQKTTPTMRRVDASSWRSEYIQRTENVRRWRRARAPTVLTDARVETIQSVALSLPHHFMLCASTAYGVASRCDPFTGKVSKGHLDVSGPVQGVSLATLGLGPAVTAMRLEADATRIAWGFQHGVVGITTLARQGTNPRGAVRGFQFSARASHAGPVTDIALPFGTGNGGAHSIERSPDRLRQRQANLGEASETFVTCGIDGTVRLWSPKRVMPLWQDIVREERLADGALGRPASLNRLAFHLESGTIVAATAEGRLLMWTAIDINALLVLPPSAFDEPGNTLTPMPKAAASRHALDEIYDKIKRRDLPRISGASADKPVQLDLMLLDIEKFIGPDAHDKGEFRKARLLTFNAEQSVLQRRSIELQEPDGEVRVADLVIPHSDDSLICVRPDFDIEQAPERPGSTIGLVMSTPTPTDPKTMTSAIVGNASPLFAERKYVCAGTQRGRLIVWDWEQDGDDLNGHVRAWFCLDAHHASITAIDMTEHAIIVGSSDGTIKAFCPLSGQLLRTFNDRTATRHPARMLAAGQLTEEQSSRFHVTQIIASEETIVAAIGSQVLAWQAEKLRSKSGAGRKSTSRTGRNTIGRLWDPKVQSTKEMERDVYETKQELQQEHEERLASRQRLGGSIHASELDGLTEQEAFEYAMMLSRDEMEAGGAASGAHELDDAMEQIARAESKAAVAADYDALEESFEENDGDISRDDEEHVSRYLHPHRSSMASSHSSSPLSSPYMRALNSPQSRAWDIVQNAGTSVTRNTRVGDAHSKVQSVHVPPSARSSLNATSPSSSRRRLSNNVASTAHSLDGPDFWPSFDPSGPMSLNARSPTRLDLGSPVPTPPSRHASFNHSGGSGAAGQPSPLPSSLTARSPLGGAWALGSPSLRPISVPAPSRSALTNSRPSNEQSLDEQSRSQQSNASLDDDLRFALELSLAEERSRNEQQQDNKGKKKM